ncbi:MAG: molybdopterin molybdotransferase MoeA [Deltaproteobacteria bacterium]|nr:molybdopterin molybdotransferase MoeA [Deltaproteobacteria bacterium]
MLTVEEALAEILGQVPRMPAESAGLLETLGRVLAEEVSSPRDLPPHDVSQMDGYAVRSEDLRGACAGSPAQLSVVARSVAGRGTDRPVREGEAARVLTGAPLPEGADAVVVQEETERDGDLLRVKVAPSPRDFVRARGADLAAGCAALAQGTLLGPAQIALLASVWRSQARVFQRPRVAVLSTGDELLDLDGLCSSGAAAAAPVPQRIIDSNSWSLCAQVLAAGATPVRLGLAPDDPEAIGRALDAAARCDVVLTSAGVSVGERDFVKDVLARRGVELRFWRVAMKPGKPLAFGLKGGQLYFALPGNPTSAMVSFEQFVRPALLTMAGRRSVRRTRLMASLEGTLAKKAGLVHFVRARSRVDAGGRLVAAPVPRQDSGLISSMAQADSLIVLPAAVEKVASGEAVEVQLLDGFEG